MAEWAGFLRGSDRIALEPHPYFAFNEQGLPDMTPYIPQPCRSWAVPMNCSQAAFGVTTAGEWSLAFLHRTDDPHTMVNCAVWDERGNYTPETK